MIGLLKRWLGYGADADSGRRLLLRPSPDVLTVERDGLAVLLDLRREIFLGLDEVGTRIWRGVQQGRTADGIASELAREFDAPVTVIRADADRFLGTLESRGLMVQQ